MTEYSFIDDCQEEGIETHKAARLVALLQVLDSMPLPARVICIDTLTAIIKNGELSQPEKCERRINQAKMEIERLREKGETTATTMNNA